jgi:hypothetical protein
MSPGASGFDAMPDNLKNYFGEAAKEDGRESRDPFFVEGTDSSPNLYIVHAQGWETFTSKKKKTVQYWKFTATVVWSAKQDVAAKDPVPAGVNAIQLVRMHNPDGYDLKDLKTLVSAIKGSPAEAEDFAMLPGLSPEHGIYLALKAENHNDFTRHNWIHISDPSALVVDDQIDPEAAQKACYGAL